ncbi:hypothetical protein OG323_22740 [Streptomyces cyaneofuscatus]|uniref:hypothetical protein n=1 Tax=Streptomyces cyaneofuscatus TaxID=66883 RepID=UPI0038703E88|nr:hypothetical protein OG323_22740 [Streptomyces cyaneofuscatus]
MIRPGLTAAGDRVRLPVGEQLLAPLVDALAIAYTQDPETVGALLAVHAHNVLRLDYAQFAESMPEPARAMRAAEADGSREALLGELPEEVQRDPLLTSDDVITLATRLTRLASHIRLHPRKARRA